MNSKRRIPNCTWNHLTTYTNCPKKLSRFPLRHQTWVFDCPIPAVPLSRRGARKTRDLCFNSFPNTQQDRLMGPSFPLLRMVCLCWFFLNVSDFLLRSCQITAFIDSFAWLWGVLGVTGFPPHWVHWHLLPNHTRIHAIVWCYAYSLSLHRFPRSSWRFSDCCHFENSRRYFIRALHCVPLRKDDIPRSFKIPLSFFAITSHVPQFLHLLIGKLSFYNSNRNRVSASDQFGHWFLLDDPGWGLSSFELLVLLALLQASELRTGDTCGIKCSGDWLHWLNWFCTPALWNKYGPGRGTGGGMISGLFHIYLTEITPVKTQP